MGSLMLRIVTQVCVGVLLGVCFECSLFTLVPFEEDSRNNKIWFVDHNFHEKMFSMFRKVNGEL
jgi:26S proteasome regulatory subunit N8